MISTQLQSEEDRKAYHRAASSAYHDKKKSDPEYLERRRAYGREYHRKNREKRRAAQIERKYGMTSADWELMFNQQQRVCAICASADPLSKNGWSVDHSHTTGKVRGILCQPCNLMLGGSRDSPAILANAIKYLN